MSDDDLRARVTDLLLAFEDPSQPQWLRAKAVDVADAIIGGLGWRQEWMEGPKHRYVTEWRVPDEG